MRLPDEQMRNTWTAAHAPVPGVPGWARTAALLVPLTALPSSLWRIAAVTLHLPIEFFEADDGTGRGDLPSWMPVEVYAVLLSVVTELLAFAAVGLVAPWGEIVPRWIPWLRGRRIPRLTAVIPAALGAVVLTTLWTWTAVSASVGRDVRGRPMDPDAAVNLDDWRDALAVVAYAPLLLWGPLLGALTVAYWLRRRRQPVAVPCPTSLAVTQRRPRCPITSASSLAPTSSADRHGDLRGGSTESRTGASTSYAKR
jgi:hypothetical protein